MSKHSIGQQRASPQVQDPSIRWDDAVQSQTILRNNTDARANIQVQVVTTRPHSRSSQSFAFSLYQSLASSFVATARQASVAFHSFSDVMAKLQLLLTALCASSALASPWSRNQKRGNHKDKGHIWGKHTTEGSPPGYETSTGWGYGGSTCTASTVSIVSTKTESVVSTKTETQEASTIYSTIHGVTTTLQGMTSYVTLPGSTYTSVSVSTVTQSASIGGPITECATTSYITRTAPGYNHTATETSLISAPGTTLTEYRYELSYFKARNEV